MSEFPPLNEVAAPTPRKKDVEVFRCEVDGEKEGVDMRFFSQGVARIHHVRRAGKSELHVDFSAGGTIVVRGPVIYIEPERH